jgi:hypothetical protein
VAPEVEIESQLAYVEAQSRTVIDNENRNRLWERFDAEAIAVLALSGA